MVLEVGKVPVKATLGYSGKCPNYLRTLPGGNDSSYGGLIYTSRSRLLPLWISLGYVTGEQVEISHGSGESEHKSLQKPLY